MARLTAEERAELEARLAADDDDEADEVEISHGDKKFKGSYKRARGVARAWGVKLEEDPPPAGEDDPDGGRTVRFGRRTG